MSSLTIAYNIEGPPAIDCKAAPQVDNTTPIITNMSLGYATLATNSYSLIK